MKFSDWVSLGSLVIASVALLYTFLSNTKKYELASQYRKEILMWYSNTVEILVKLKVEVKDGGGDPNSMKELLSKLSSQIEIGRFYFPNIDKGDGYGEKKPSAYKGYRNLILDLLVYSYSISQRPDAPKYVQHLETLQRLFTSHVFQTLEPRKFLKETHKLTSRIFAKDLSVEDFLKEDPSNIEYYYKATEKGTVA